jgi:magnesium chelatase family protein
LFLDELPEFQRRVLEVLREPMESGEIAISRAARQVTFPARFQVVAAMNPCPCGYSGHPAIECQCGPAQVMRYRSKISGPLLDRFDLHVEVPVQTGEVLLGSGEAGESSASVRERVLKARAAQTERGSLNAALAGNLLHQSCQLDAGSEKLLSAAMERLGLSARALHRILRVARTLADLDGERGIARNHLMEALGYRQLDRQQNQGPVVSA